MCCMQLAENTERKITPKIAICAPLHNCRAISSQLRHVLTIGKKPVKWQYLLHMSSWYAELWPINGWDLLVSLRHPADLTGFASWLHYCTDVAHRRRSMDVNQTLHDVWLSPALVYYLYIFGGSCPLTQFSQLQTSLCIQVFQSPILAALSVLHGTRAVGVSQSLWRGTRIGSMELSQMAAPIFGRAAITLSIDPHCSYIILTSCVN